MSADLIAAAAATPAAFDPTPLPESLSACHVPFTHLIGRPLETEIGTRLVGYERLALTGPTGCGKSSLARYALRTAGQPLAPIWINVATEDHTRIATVRGFLEILVSQLVSRANAAQEMSDGERRRILRSSQLTEPLGRSDVKIRGELGGSYWLLSGRVAREITRSVDHGTAYRATEDIRNSAREALATIVDQDLVPVLVADDTDRLLNVGATSEDRERLFIGFFGEVLREIADQLECALLLAAHDKYREHDEYTTLTTGLITPIAVPELDRPEQMAAIATARVEFIDEQASWRDIITADAVDYLLELYRTHNRSLRKTLTDLREALGLAASEAADFIERRHLEAAVAGRS